MKQRIDILLVERGICETRAKAQARILAGEVVVDDQRVDKAGTKVSATAEIRLKGNANPWVSRGGLKLVRALEWFRIAPKDQVWMDVGASTGGFTHVLLEHGASFVHAIDVGYGQLAWRLRQDPRVQNWERTHIAKLAEGSLAPPPQGFVVDVSFISLDLVLPAIVPHLTVGAVGVALIKPQFEVGKEAVGKGGIVRDEAARLAAVERVLARAAHAGLHSLGRIESPITGSDGNVEYLSAFHFSPSPDDVTR